MKHIKTLSGQALKAIFKLNPYICHFTDLSPNHILDLFNKLIRQILCYGAQVWGFSNSVQQERVYLQFCKKLLGVKKSTKNDFVYGEFGRVSLKNYIFTWLLINGLRYWKVNKLSILDMHIN